MYDEMDPVKMGRRQKIALLSLILLMSLVFSCAQTRQSVYRKNKPLMDTIVAITVVADSGQNAEKAIEDAFSTIERFGDLINFFSDKSELSLINRNSGIREVKVSPDTLGVIERAIYISEMSGGAFDPTIGPEIKMWDFFKKIRPSDSDIKKKLSLVNYRDIVIDRDKSTVFLRKKAC